MQRFRCNSIAVHVVARIGHRIRFVRGGSRKSVKAVALIACMFAAMVCSGCASTSGAEEPEYGVCRKQVVRFVEEKLGHTVKRVDIKAYADRSGPGHFDLGNALAFVEECHGFHSFALQGTWSERRHIPHYGVGADYIYYEGPFGGCKRK